MDNILKVNVKAEGVGFTKTVVKARNFEIVIDEPEALGGTNEGPNPVEYLAAALAGCLNVVCHVVAKEKKIKLEKLEMEIEGELDLRGFMGDNTVRPGYKSLNVKIKVESDATQDQLNDWIKEVEKRCPVGDNIRNQTPIKISVEK